MSEKMGGMQRFKVVIVGGGSAGWMTAAAMGRFLDPQRFSIQLVESAQIGTVGVGEATIPHIRQFNQMLGIDENQFMQATGATYKLGIQFNGWGSENSSYIHPFGFSGEDIAGVGFHHAWLKAKKAGQARDFQQYSIACQMALAGKFQYQSEDETSLLSHYSYAFHLDATQYGLFLKQLAQQAGVERIEDKITSVHQHSSGDIKSLVLQDGQEINGDFFIDCSGFRSLLVGESLQQPFDNWQHWLPCDSALALATKKMDTIVPYTQASAHTAGWRWRIPLQHRTGNGWVYASDFMSDSSAQQQFSEHLEIHADKAPKKISFVTGKRTNSWVKNCVAIGLSAGFLEPLESTSLYLTQIAIQRLIELFPQNGVTDVERDYFNRTLNNEYLKVRDFLILHYKLNQRQDSDFWRYCADMSIPDSLQQQMDLFKQHACVDNYRQGLFMQPSWLAVYLGQGFYPLTDNSALGKLSSDSINQQLERYYQSVQNAVAKMPAHQHALDATAQRSEQSTAHYPAVGQSLYGRLC
ncbi:tryptophan halogenase family protein [Neptunicella marina]|uniref:Tryptophan 7-halogenase n=1 Tax=Neptunicella marina TaxID=2125989 RepID=A0A8J6IP97_9ALTE|nr:tryptophan halogenase family protein [Neptunicella marina]MBC3765430.1 tryptophan 7-halogenase [Neptunicella marina]